MKKSYIFYLLASFLYHFSSAQPLGGLENIIVEKFYISEPNDTLANADGGILPVGSVTYRIYVDMLPGYVFQAAYGVPPTGSNPGHELRFETTTGFFNNTDRGNTSPTYTKNQTRLNTVMLDSWFSVGAACAGHYGIEKSSDNGVNTTVNNFTPQILQSQNPQAGIPLTQQDGLLAGNPLTVTFVGIPTPLLDMFNNTNAVNPGGMVFSVDNGSWASLNGSMGSDSLSNKVLIAQITTNGVFSFKLNLQIRSANNVVENYVAENPVGNEVQHPALIYNSSLLTSFDQISKWNSLISVYPNPASDIVNIQFPACEHRHSDTGNFISIHGIGGNEISRTSLTSLSEKASTELIDISDLRPGVYFLRMGINGTTVTRKLIRN
jgi:hypothetical protein